MKVKTSITLSKEILDLIEENIEKTENRSRFIENAIRYYMKHYQQSIRDAKDLSIINENYQKLNKEAEEVLDFQDVAF